MVKKKLQRVKRRLTDEQRARHSLVRESVIRDFPPKPGRRRKASPPGIPAQIRAAREEFHMQTDIDDAQARR